MNHQYRAANVQLRQATKQRHSVPGYFRASFLRILGTLTGRTGHKGVVRVYVWIKKIFSGFFRASFVNSFISSIIYPKHADRHADQIYGENLFDRLHIVAKELAGDPVYFDPECTYPTHTEIRYMADAIEPRTAKILDKPFRCLG